MYVLSEKLVITRKEHKCDFCNRPFKKGNKMRRQSLAHDGVAYTLYTCMTCDSLMSRHSKFFIDEVEDAFFAGCVAEQLLIAQTPEDLLHKLDSGEIF